MATLHRLHKHRVKAPRKAWDIRRAEAQRELWKGITLPGRSRMSVRQVMDAMPGVFRETREAQGPKPFTRYRCWRRNMAKLAPKSVRLSTSPAA